MISSELESANSSINAAIHWRIGRERESIPQSNGLIRATQRLFLLLVSDTLHWQESKHSRRSLFADDLRRFWPWFVCVCVSCAVLFSVGQSGHLSAWCRWEGHYKYKAAEKGSQGRLEQTAGKSLKQRVNWSQREAAQVAMSREEVGADRQTTGQPVKQKSLALSLPVCSCQHVSIANYWLQLSPSHTFYLRKAKSFPANQPLSFEFDLVTFFSLQKMLFPISIFSSSSIDQYGITGRLR